MIPKTKIANLLRGIVARHADNVFLSGLEAELVGIVFECHPEYRQKAGCGVAGFIIETDSRWGKTRHFSVVRTDGTKEDFSWKICLDGKLPSVRSDALFAMREAIADQTMHFKVQAFGGQSRAPCALTGQLVPMDGCHIDHVSPRTFESLVLVWLHRHDLELEDVELRDSADGYSKQMANPGQISSWTEFHRRNAQLRILSPHAHLTLTKTQPSYPEPL